MAEPLTDAELSCVRDGVACLFSARPPGKEPGGSEFVNGPLVALRVARLVPGLLARLDATEPQRDALRAALRELRDAAEGLDGLPGGCGGRYARALLGAARLLGEG